jgi:hypothetical protein
VGPAARGGGRHPHGARQWPGARGWGCAWRPCSPRPVRRYRHDHGQQRPGKQELTATPTAAVGFALLAPVRLVPWAMEKATSLQGHQLIVCEAVGIAPAWSQGRAMEHNALPRATPP